MVKSFFIKQYAYRISAKVDHMAKSALTDQESIMQQIVTKAKNTMFGRDHDFDQIDTYEDFKKAVPIRDYEALRTYVDQVVEGKADVLWPGKPKYFAKTSGTTSGVKYIPLTHDSMPNHMLGARYAVLRYIAQQKNASVFNGKAMFLSGSPTLTDTGGVPTGRLSGIVNHEIPFWLKTNQVPSFETNCIGDWEQKVERVVDETVRIDLRLIGGIPPWIQMYYERLLERTGKATVKEVFPNLSLFVYGGVNFEPYRQKLEQLVGESIDSIELFPASEGFFAYQDQQGDQGLLLNTNSGIFYEFVPLQEIGKPNPKRLTLSEVKLDEDYALVISNNAGLWAYDIGDCVRFVSIDPYKIVVSGRVKHYISAFGEHVIGKEVEEAILSVANREGVQIVEFTVAPQVNPPDGSTPYHEWFVEFGRSPTNLETFAKNVDLAMAEQNIYYKDLIEGKILQPLKIRPLQAESFREYMKTQGKLGGQNKVPRLSNNRKIADFLTGYVKNNGD